MKFGKSILMYAFFCSRLLCPGESTKNDSKEWAAELARLDERCEEDRELLGRLLERLADNERILATTTLEQFTGRYGDALGEDIFAFIQQRLEAELKDIRARIEELKRGCPIM